MTARRRRLVLVALAASVLVGGASRGGAAPAPDATAAAPRVVRVQIQGTIDVATAAFLRRGLKHAETSGAAAFVVELDTPGGLLAPMEDMVRALLGARVPTVVYVAPAGGHAWSAGAVITMAAAVAAMAPATSIGAAHPVSLGPGGGPRDGRRDEPPRPGPGKGERPPAPGSPPAAARPAAAPPATAPAGPVARADSERPELQKVLNAVTEQARAIARARGRDEDFAARMVRESATVGADEAVRRRVVDLGARTLEELLLAIDGRTVTVAERPVILRTAGARIETIAPSFKERFLHVLNDPNILLVLITLASLGLLFELQTPGVVLPGVVGGIALLLSLYSLSVLPVSWAGLGLLGFGLVLLIVDVKYPTHGVLTVGGLGSFVLGAIMLIDTSFAPALRVSWYVVVGTALTFGAFFAFAMTAAARAHRRPVATGVETLVGAVGIAQGRLDTTGTVLVGGELWQAHADEPVAAGEHVVVVAVDRLTLTVVHAPEAGDYGARGTPPHGGNS